jgi:hypothetical protein
MHPESSEKIRSCYALGCRHLAASLRHRGELDGQAGFAGQAICRFKFSGRDAATARFLELEAVREISEVTLNGRSLGVSWYGRHLYAFPSGLRADGNELEMRVTTISGNYAKSLTANEAAQRWTKNLAARPMGLLGPGAAAAGGVRHPIVSAPRP